MTGQHQAGWLTRAARATKRIHRRLRGRRRDVWAAEPSAVNNLDGGPRHRQWLRDGGE